MAWVWYHWVARVVHVILFIPSRHYEVIEVWVLVEVLDWLGPLTHLLHFDEGFVILRIYLRVGYLQFLDSILLSFGCGKELIRYSNSLTLIPSVLRQHHFGLKINGQLDEHLLLTKSIAVDYELVQWIFFLQYFYLSPQDFISFVLCCEFFTSATESIIKIEVIKRLSLLLFNLFYHFIAIIAEVSGMYHLAQWSFDVYHSRT